MTLPYRHLNFKKIVQFINRTTGFFLLTGLLVACFENNYNVTQQEVIGIYKSDNGYTKTLFANHRFLTFSEGNKLVSSGLRKLEENGSRIEFRFCKTPMLSVCSSFTNFVRNNVIGSNGTEITIGNGDPPEDDYKKTLVRETQ